MFNLPPRLPCLSPRGGAWGVRGPSGGARARSGGGPRGCSFPNELPSSGRGSELRTQGMQRVWDLALRHPSPTASRALPAEAAGGGRPCRAGGRAGGRERGKEGGPAEEPAPRPERHLPSDTYRGSSGSQGRGRSSSERSVHPHGVLKRRQREPTGLSGEWGSRSCPQSPPEPSAGARDPRRFSLEGFLRQCCQEGARSFGLRDEGGFLSMEAPPPTFCRRWTGPVGGTARKPRGRPRQTKVNKATAPVLCFYIGPKIAP